MINDSTINDSTINEKYCFDDGLDGLCFLAGTGHQL